MAAGVSGSVSFTSGGKTLRVYYAQTFTPGVAKSTVTISRVTLQCNVDYSRTFYFDGNIIVNGQTVYSRSVESSDGAVTATTWEDTINRCTGGKVTVDHSAATDITIQLARNTYGSPYFYNASGNSFSISGGSRTVTLSAIPMASGISAGAVTLGSEMTVSLIKAAEGMTDTVTWQCGALSGTIAENSAETEFTWTPPVSLASQSPSSSAVNITITTATFNGDTGAGSKSIIVSCPIPDSVKPTATLIVTDKSGNLDTYGNYIQSRSQAQVSIAANGVYESTISSVFVTCGELSGFGTDLVFDLPNSGTVTVKAVITDSRNRNVTVSTTISVVPYAVPSSQILSVYRCDSQGIEDPDGAYAIATFEAMVTPLNNLNTASYSLKYRVRNSVAWTRISLNNITGNYLPSNITQIFPAKTDNGYEICLEVSDEFVTITSAYKTISVAFKLMDFDRSKKAIGIGQIATMENAVAVGIPIQMYQDYIPNENKELTTKEYVDGRKLAFFEIQVPSSDFVEDTTYGDYGFRAAVALDGALSSMVPEVIFGAADAAGGNYCPVAQTYDGGLYIYAASVPDSDVTIPTILCWRCA